MTSTADPPEVAFTDDQIADARRLGKELRRMAAMAPELRDPAAVRDFEDSTGRPAEPAERLLSCDALDGVLAGRDPAPGSTGRPRPGRPGPRARPGHGVIGGPTTGS